MAQAGLPSDLLPTVTAFISATPNLGGVLGVGIIGTGKRRISVTFNSLSKPSTVINSAFRKHLSNAVSGADLPHINDAVLASQDPKFGQQVIASYVAAFQLGFRILAGIAVFKFILCLGLKRVVLDDGKVMADQIGMTGLKNEGVKVEEHKTDKISSF